MLLKIGLKDLKNNGNGFFDPTARIGFVGA